MRKLILASVFLTAACGQPIRIQTIPVPPQYLTCKDEPAIPAQPSAEERDRVLARYIVSLRDAGQHCRDQLAAVKLFIDESK